MSEIEITLPTVAYGNVKVRATPEELGLSSLADAHALGVASAVYLATFTLGFKEGARIDVTAPQEPSRGEVDQSPQEAENVHERAVQALREGLGATEVGAEEGKPPWNKKTEAKKRPWEAGAASGGDGW